ncbi:MAG: amidophosphoribosyltransferase [Oscillospiraceae bacterium]
MCDKSCLQSEKLHEECGVFGIARLGDETVDVAYETRFALYALQHRGQESCGISVNDCGVISTVKDVGLVPEVLTNDLLDSLPKGQMAIGHVRYATMGSANAINAQPIVVKHAKGTLSLAHNGNLTNAAQIREEYQNQGIVFHTSNDTEVIAYTIAKERLSCHSIEEAVKRATQKIKGAYSMVVLSPRKLIAARDPQGFRPLVIGTLEKGGYVFASETCALDAVGAKYLRDVRPGEIVEIFDGELKVYQEGLDKACGFCVFEYIYFARPDSVLEGQSVHEARKLAGALLAKAYPVQADVVIGVPDSGLDAAQGYALESGIPYGVGFLKNRYIGRTFIQPGQAERENAVKIKLNTIASTVRGKRVIMIDDSIVRGTTSQRIVKLLRDAGATEVHMRVTAPPFTNPCYFGTDIDSRENLIACQMTHSEIEKNIGVDSLGFLSVEDAKKLAPNSNCSFCLGCFTGEYPIETQGVQKKDKFEEKINK